MVARELSRAINGMNSLELRVLFALLALRERGELSYKVSYQELNRLLNIERGGKQYTKTKTAMESLMVKSKIRIPSYLSRTNGDVSCFIIPKVLWGKENENIADIRFDEDITPLLDDLKGNYDFYLLSQMALFTSSDYSALIYQFCTSILPTKEKSIQYIWWLDKTETNPDSFREWTGTLKKYPEWYELKRWAIDPAIREINEKSDIEIKYVTKKKGRSVVGLNMTITRKDKPKKVVDQPQMLPPELIEDPNLLEEVVVDQEEQTTLDDFMEMNDFDRRIDFLKGACAEEFDTEQMEYIYSIINHKEYTDLSLGKDIAMYEYLSRQYKSLNITAKKKEAENKPIKNRFKYFTAILKKDCGVE